MGLTFFGGALTRAISGTSPGGFGLTRERIRQIEAKALRKLRHPLRGRNLKAFVEN